MTEPHPTSGELSKSSRALGAASLAAVALLALLLSWSKLGDVDCGYHVAYGNHFLRTGHIVDRDPFLVPENAVEFVNANWGSQVVMAFAHNAAGPWGLAILRTILLSVGFASCATMVWRRTRNHGWLTAALLLIGLCTYERFSMRPELFSFAAMTWMLALLTRPTITRKTILLLGLLQLVWVNTHSYFLIGPLMVGAFWFPRWLRSVTRRGTPEAIIARSQARRLLAVLGLVIVVCFINPWGHRGALFPLRTLEYLRETQVLGAGPSEGGASAWSLISEFHSPLKFIGEPINARTIDAYIVLLAVAAIGTVALLVEGRAAEAIVVILLGVMSLQMRRNIAPFAFAAVPLLTGGLANAIAWSRLPRRPRELVVAASQVAVVIAASVWAMQVVSGRFYYSERRITRQFGVGYHQFTFPEGAARWLAGQEAVLPPLFVDYFSSSNSLLWLPERFKLFIDTNTFACPEPVLDQAFSLGLGRLEHERVLDSLGVNALLLHCGPDTQNLVRAIVADDFHWALVYFDRTSVIFVRRRMEHVPHILAHVLTPESLDARQWIAELRGPSATSAMSLCTAANVPICLGWWRPAMELLTEAVRLAPDYHEAWLLLGVCDGNLANAAARKNQFKDAAEYYTAAIECFDRVLSLRPEHPQAKALRHNTDAALRYLRGER